MWKDFLRRLTSHPAPLKSPAGAGEKGARDGRVAVEGRRVIVTDPGPGGRFPVLVPGPGVIVRVNGTPLAEPMPVSAADNVEWELAPDDQQPFFRIEVAPDRMSASVEILQDPFWYPDGVEPRGDGEVTLVPVVRSRHRRRPEDPVAAIRSALQAAGVTFGVDETAVGRLVEAAAKGWRGTEVVARGQEAQAPTPDEWAWEEPPLGLVEAGQVVGTVRPGQPNRPRIDVTGTETWVHTEVASPQVELGPGLRRLPGGQVVATRTGRLQVQATPQGTRADVVPCRVLTGEIPPGTTLECQEDVVVQGEARELRIQTAGTVIIAGPATGCEVTASAIEVHGPAEACRLHTIPPGHPGPFLGHLRILIRQLAELATGPDPVPAFRRAQTTFRQMMELIRRHVKLEPDLQNLLTECGRMLFDSPEAVTPARAAGLVAELNGWITRCQQALDQRGSIELREDAFRCQVWSAQDVVIGGSRVFASEIYAGREIRCLKGSVARSELTAAQQVIIQGTASQAGAPMTARAGTRIYAEEVVPGTRFEMGGQFYEFRAEMFRVTAGLTARYELQIRQDTRPEGQE
ncbi:MAG: hypothetical protein L6E13_03250 [Firmicutes bacterium]|nr:hypothetical protein [Bacillota bacterium]